MSNRNRAANTTINNTNAYMRLELCLPKCRRVKEGVCVFVVEEARGCPKIETQVAFRFRHIIQTKRASINNVIKINYPLHSSLFLALARLRTLLNTSFFSCFTALFASIFTMYRFGIWYLEFGEIVIVCCFFCVKISVFPSIVGGSTHQHYICFINVMRNGETHLLTPETERLWRGIRKQKHNRKNSRERK